MNKLALVGKDISHSRSPEMYKKLISSNVQYDLLDYQDSLEIPTAIELLKIYDGINITSPYKKYFLNQIELTPIAKKIGAINCLKKYEDKVVGENTDYFAIVEILKALQEKYGEIDVVILGDGVTSNVTKLALDNLNFKFNIFSRRLTNRFDQLNLNEYYHSSKKLPVVINTCSREYVFNGSIPRNALFWDFNYNFMPHSTSIPDKVYKYMDGLEMLERQAFYAVTFWSSDISI